MRHTFSMTIGAIIQIEDVPVYYDVYGRIIQAGEVEISYRNRAISRIGGLHIYYNSYGDYDYYTGYINSTIDFIPTAHGMGTI